MKIASILILMIGLSATSVVAQEISEEGAKKELTPEERANKRTEMMTKKLGLSAEQKEKVSAINLAHVMEMEKIHEEMKALKKRAREEKQKTKSEIESVLDDNQKAIFEEEVNKHKEEREKRRKEKCDHGHE